MHNEFSCCIQQLSCSNGEAALPVAGVPNCSPGWLTWGGADARMVAEAVTEMVAGGWSWLQVTTGRRKKHAGGAAMRRKKTDGGFWWSAGGCVGFLWWS